MVNWLLGTPSPMHSFTFQGEQWSSSSLSPLSPWASPSLFSSSLHSPSPSLILGRLQSLRWPWTDSPPIIKAMHGLWQVLNLSYYQSFTICSLNIWVSYFVWPTFHNLDGQVQTFCRNASLHCVAFPRIQVWCHCFQPDKVIKDDQSAKMSFENKLPGHKDVLMTRERFSRDKCGGIQV